MDVQWHVPMEFHFCDFWCVMFCPEIGGPLRASHRSTTNGGGTSGGKKRNQRKPVKTHKDKPVENL